MTDVSFVQGIRNCWVTCSNRGWTRIRTMLWFIRLNVRARLREWWRA